MEREICQWVWKNLDQTAHIPEKYLEHCDIICDEIGNIEVKEDYQACQTENYAIEFENYKGEPSGLGITKATYYVLVDDEVVCMLKTDDLKEIISNYKYKKIIPMGDERTNGEKCKGWLIPRELIINNSTTKVIPRWFSNWGGKGA